MSTVEAMVMPAPDRPLERRRLHGRRLRPADRLACRRTRPDRAGRHGRGPGERPRGAQRGDLRAALGRAARLRRRGAGRTAQAARRLGVEDALDITATPDPAERVRWVSERTAGRGADVVIEASGNPAAVREGLEMLRDAGTYVVVGQYTDAGDVTLNPHRHVNRRHASLLGCWGYEFTHLQRALALMAKHAARFRWRELVTHEYPLSQAARALEDM